MVIHVIGTVNGQVNEGMRNVATHLAKEFEKIFSFLKDNWKTIRYKKWKEKRTQL